MLHTGNESELRGLLSFSGTDLPLRAKASVGFPQADPPVAEMAETYFCLSEKEIVLQTVNYGS